MGITEEDDAADAQLARPAAEFAGHFEPLGRGPAGGDGFQLGFEFYAAAFLRGLNDVDGKFHGVHVQFSFIPGDSFIFHSPECGSGGWT